MEASTRYRHTRRHLGRRRSKTCRHQQQTRRGPGTHSRNMVKGEANPKRDTESRPRERVLHRERRSQWSARKKKIINTKRESANLAPTWQQTPKPRHTRSPTSNTRTQTQHHRYPRKRQRRARNERRRPPPHLPAPLNPPNPQNTSTNRTRQGHPPNAHPNSNVQNHDGLPPNPPLPLHNPNKPNLPHHSPQKTIHQRKAPPKTQSPPFHPKSRLKRPNPSPPSECVPGHQQLKTTSDPAFRPQYRHSSRHTHRPPSPSPAQHPNPLRIRDKRINNASLVPSTRRPANCTRNARRHFHGLEYRICRWWRCQPCYCSPASSYIGGGEGESGAGV